MGRKEIVFIIVFLQYTRGQQYKLCNNIATSTQSCSSQVLPDHLNNNSCLVENISPIDCGDDFGPATLNYNIGKVSIQPHVLPLVIAGFKHDYIVPTIVFRDIKWKRMKFRIRKFGSDVAGKHCRSIIISDNVTIKKGSVLNYDCYWSLTDGDLNGQAHILDFEATDGVVFERGQYYFYIPSVKSLNSAATETDWKPFVYVENFNYTMKLYILPPPKQLNITGYRIDVKKVCDEGVTCDENVELATLNSSDDVITLQYSPTKSGWYFYDVTPIHDKCDVLKGTCRSVRSPKIYLALCLMEYCCGVNADSEKIFVLQKRAIRGIYNLSPRDSLQEKFKETVKPLLYLFIAIGVTVAIVLIFVYVMSLRYCKKPSEIPQPTKVLVIYSPSNDLHAKCVASFVDYLRSECGFDMMYDGDVTETTHWDPYFWAEEAIRNASHIIYIVGTKESHESFHPHNTEKLLLSFLKAVRALDNKDVVNVCFEYSNASIPNETRNDRVFNLLKDWQKLIAHLSKNLLPKTHITRTSRGQQFYDDLSRSHKVLSDRNLGV